MVNHEMQMASMSASLGLSMGSPWGKISNKIVIKLTISSFDYNQLDYVRVSVRGRAVVLDLGDGVERHPHRRHHHEGDRYHRYHLKKGKSFELIFSLVVILAIYCPQASSFQCEKGKKHKGNKKRGALILDPALVAILEEK